jgi:glycerol-3-phosphate acyltransferase PlsY
MSYVLGSIPFGYLIVRWRRGIDVRETGSRSIGATNVMRNLGIGGFVATFLLDAGKGFASVWLTAKLTASSPTWIALAALAAVAGHIFPVWLKFRGGKGVATGVGVFLALAPVPMGLSLLIFAVLVGIWRYVSLGSIIATAAFPLLLYFLNPPSNRPSLPIVLGAAGCAAVIIGKHHANIRRLLSGTENRLGSKTSVARSS